MNLKYLSSINPKSLFEEFCLANNQLLLSNTKIDAPKVLPVRELQEIVPIAPKVNVFNPLPGFVATNRPIEISGPPESNANKGFPWVVSSGSLGGNLGNLGNSGNLMQNGFQGLFSGAYGIGPGKPMSPNKEFEIQLEGENSICRSIVIPSFKNTKIDRLNDAKHILASVLDDYMQQENPKKDTKLHTFQPDIYLRKRSE